MWLEDEGIGGNTAESWNDNSSKLDVTGIFTNQLQRLRKRFSNWDKQTFGNILNRRKQFL